jgi:hypothetical protein
VLIEMISLSDVPHKISAFEDSTNETELIFPFKSALVRM